MRYDVTIIGGGLSALVCGLALQKAGRRTLMISEGESAIQFSSGTFGFLSFLPDGTVVDHPLEAVPQLPPGHPYSKIGAQRLAAYAEAVPGLFAECGIVMHGSALRNSYRLCSTGLRKRAWLAFEDTTLLAGEDDVLGRKALIVNFQGYLDFYPAFISSALSAQGTECRTEEVVLPEVQRLRLSRTEMRSVNIARVMDDAEVLKKFVLMLREMIKDEDVLVLPQVFGCSDTSSLQYIRSHVRIPVVFVGTAIPSVPGMRAQRLLTKAYERSGGTLMLGDSVVSGDFAEDRLLSVRTANLGDFPISSDSFVLATGHLFGKGLVADPGSFRESVFGLDVDYAPGRDKWSDKDFYARQDYMGFGVSTDGDFHPSLASRKIENLYAIGSMLGGANPLKEGSGAGIAVMTALAVAEKVG